MYWFPLQLLWKSMNKRCSFSQPLLPVHAPDPPCCFPLTWYPLFLLTPHPSSPGQLSHPVPINMSSDYYKSWYTPSRETVCESLFCILSPVHFDNAINTSAVSDISLASELHTIFWHLGMFWGVRQLLPKWFHLLLKYSLNLRKKGTCSWYPIEVLAQGTH